MIALDLEDPKPVCKGLILKAIVNNFVTESYIAFNTKLQVAKRRSCKGCEQCGWLLDAFADHLGCVESGAIINMEIVQPEKFYKLETCNIGYDHETGWVDSYDFKLTPIE